MFLIYFSNKFTNSNGKIGNKLLQILLFVVMGVSFSYPSNAKVLIVRAPFKTITLNYDRRNISLTGHQLDLSLKRKKCNGHILDRFRRQMEGLLKSKSFKEKRNEKASLEIQVGVRRLFVPFRSKEAQFLLNLPIEIKRMKLEGIFICRRKYIF